MYERSAIVLERYFNNILGYFSENNLKVNFENYCELVDKLFDFQNKCEQEQTATQEFQDSTDRLKSIQKNQERLYQKSAKLEFNRNILFNNIADKTTDLESCLIKIEDDVDKNKESLKKLRINYIDTLNEYNEKNKILTKSKKEKKEAEKLYKEILNRAKENVMNINEFVLEFARNFNASEIREKVIKLMTDNGKEEKIPFDTNVINLATDLGIDVAQREVKCYVEIYDNIMKLFDEIEKDAVKIEKFQKRLRNIKVKLNFLFAEKEYLVQFLDYERITSVSGKRTHKKLMLQACENFELDIKQINNLYELILKEIAGKATKKAYKELYNKSSLLDINKEEATFKKEKNKVSIDVGTVLGSNYWRIEGIKNIYTVFYKEISETFGKDVDEFDVPDDDEDIDTEFAEELETESIVKAKKVAKNKDVEIIEEVKEEELPQLIFEDELAQSVNVIEKNIHVEDVEEVIVEKKKTKVAKKEKVLEKIQVAETVEDIEEFNSNINNSSKTEDEIVKDVKKENKIQEIVENDTIQEIIEEDLPYEDDDQEYEIEEEEESLFGNIKSIKEKNVKVDFDMMEELNSKRKGNKKGIFKSLIKMNSKNDKKATN